MTTTTKTVAATAFVLTILSAGLPADAQIQGDFPEVVLFASESMQIGASAEVFSGDVVVNQASPGTLTFGNKAKTPSGYEVKANSIVVGNNVTLGGAEYCNAGNITCAPGGLSLPVYTLLPLFKGSTPSGSNVTVAGGGSATVTGNALDITVAANGTLIFTPGVHNVRSITADNKTNIVFSGPTEVRVQNGMTLGLEGNVNRFLGAPAKDVVFYVGGGATLGSKGSVNANFYVASGTLELPASVIASGAFLAKNLVVGSKTQLTLASAFVNHPPMAVNDAITVTEDASATVIDVLFNDSDPDGDSITVANVADPAKGTATTDGATVSYTPDPNYFGVDVFNYQVCDDSTAINGDKCATATITVTVTPVNDAPNAADDSATTAEDNAVTVTVLANDNAGPANESQALTVTAVTQGGSGSVATDGTTVTYTPSSNFFGSDSFGYTACDSGDGAGDATVLCDTATVSVTVTSVNDPPVLTDDSATTAEDVAVTVAVLGNDNAGPGNESQGLTVASVAGGSLGLVSTDGTTVTYTPAADANGSDSFAYTACDAGDSAGDATVQCSTASVAVTIDPVNDPPVAVDDAVSTAEETLVSIDVLANDTAGPANENQAKTLDGVGQAANGSVAIIDGKVDYTPNQDFSGEDTFPYTVCDGGDDDNTSTDGDDLCATGSVTVTVTNVNDAPTADPQDLFAIATVTITLTASDPDGDSLTFSVVTSPTKGTLGAITPVVPSGGGPVVSATVDYTPTSCAGDPLECDEDSFVFQVDDGNTGTDTATVTINPGGDATDEPPSVSNIDAKDDSFETATGVALEITLVAAAEAGIDDLVFTIDSGPTGGSLSSVTPVDPIVQPIRSARTTYSPSCTPTSPPIPPVCSDSFVFKACEAAAPANCDTATVTITVGDADTTPPDPPVAEDISVATDSGVTKVFTLEASAGGSIPSGEDEGREQQFAFAPQSPSGGGINGTGSVRSSASLGDSQFGPLAAITPDAGWSSFSWSGTPQQGCTNPPLGVCPLEAPVFSTSGPFDFTGDGCVSVTDDFLKGDRFAIYDNQQLVGATPVVAIAGPDQGVGADIAFADPAFSSGTFTVSGGGGSHSITIEVLLPSFASGAAYVRVDSPNSSWCNRTSGEGGTPLLTYTLVTVPSETFGTLADSSGASVQAGSVLTNPSLTFTPVASTGTSSFTYQVTNTQTGLTSLVATVDLSIGGFVNLCLSDKDACDKGRDLGGGQGGSGLSAPTGGGVLRGGAALTVAVSGPGDVSSSRPHADGRSYKGLVCSSDSECSGSFVRGSTVVLHARPLVAGSEFVEWGGDCQGTAPVALVRAGTDRFCTATFRQKSE